MPRGKEWLLWLPSKVEFIWAQGVIFHYAAAWLLPTVQWEQLLSLRSALCVCNNARGALVPKLLRDAAAWCIACSGPLNPSWNRENQQQLSGQSQMCLQYYRFTTHSTRGVRQTLGTRSSETVRVWGQGQKRRRKARTSARVVMSLLWTADRRKGESALHFVSNALIKNLLAQAGIPPPTPSHTTQVNYSRLPSVPYINGSYFYRGGAATAGFHFNIKQNQSPVRSI